jgi:serine/threonine protein kinase
MVSQEPGTEIAGYRIESLIGRGGMAVVYRAEDMRLGRKVALKLLTPQLADSDQFRQRFMRESRLAASLDHPNIVPIYEAGEADGQLFIAMRYVIGSDLKGVLLDEGGRLPVDRTLGMFLQIGDALDTAHRAGLVHRDVKPGNILVAARHDRSRSGQGDHVYLTDFGLTKRTSGLTGGLTGTGHFLGTVDYVAPEQIQGRPVGAATDIYALGCVLYECLTGHLPFHRDDDAALLWAHLVEAPPPVTGIRPEVPAGVDGVVSRAMAKDPDDRYDTCEELLRDLELALGMPAPVSSPGGRPSGDSGPTRHGKSGSDLSWAEPGTVTGNVPDDSRHPSFPSGDIPRFAPIAPASRDSAPPADDRADGERSAVSGADDGARQDLERGFDTEADDDPRDWEAADGSQEDWDQGEWQQGSRSQAEWEHGAWAEQPQAPPPKRRRWKLGALIAAAVLVVAVGAFFALRATVFAEDYRTFTSRETVVQFQLDHPASWGSKALPSSDIVLGPDPTTVSDLFYLRGSPEAWVGAAGAVRAGAPEDVWLYVSSLAAAFDTSDVQALQDTVTSLLPANTRVDGAPDELTVAGSQAVELEAVTSDPSDPQTEIRALVDVVQTADGAVLLAFYAPPATFEDHRGTFEKIRDSLEFIG